MSEDRKIEISIKQLANDPKKIMSSLWEDKAAKDDLIGSMPEMEKSSIIQLIFILCAPKIPDVDGPLNFVTNSKLLITHKENIKANTGIEIIDVEDFIKLNQEEN